MENTSFLMNKRLKILGIFIVAVSIFVEIPLRLLCHKISEFLLFIEKEPFLSEKALIIVREIFTQSSPLIFLYFPSLVWLIIIARDGLQRTDWFVEPFLIGLLLKGGIYGLISMKYQSGEFWQLAQAGVPQPLLYFLIFFFFVAVIAGLIIWVQNILTLKE